MKINLNRFATAALLSAFATPALADVQYTQVMSMFQNGKPTPMNTTTTLLKDGFQRTDTKQEIGAYKMNQSVITDAGRREITTYDPTLKMFYVEPIGGGGSATGGAGTAANAQPAANKNNTGKMILTVGAKFIGNEKLLDYNTRHYETTQAMESSGCCGTSNTKFKTEVWMADVKLPSLNLPGEAWQRSYGAGDGGNDCQITFERKGDVAEFDKAHQGLAIKTIMYDAQKNTPLTQQQITMLSFAALEDSQFAVPAGFKKVAKADFEKARQAAMMASFSNPGAGARRDEDEAETDTDTEEKPARQPAQPAAKPDAGDVAEDVTKEAAKQKARRKLRLPF